MRAVMMRHLAHLGSSNTAEVQSSRNRNLAGTPDNEADYPDNDITPDSPGRQAWRRGRSCWCPPARRSPPRGTAAALAGTGRAAPSVGGDFAYLSFTIGMTFQVSAPAGLPGDHPGGRYGDGGRRPCAARRDQRAVRALGIWTWRGPGRPGRDSAVERDSRLVVSQRLVASPGGTGIGFPRGRWCVNTG